MTSARLRRLLLLLLGLILLLPASGCGLLLDEFMWLDRTPPAHGAPDRNP